MNKPPFQMLACWCCLLILALSLHGCATPVGVNSLTPEKANEKLTENVLSNDSLSAPTQQLRNRAGLADLKLSDFTSADKLFEQIANVERPKEFGCEFGRGFDLIRWGFFHTADRQQQLKEHETFRRSIHRVKEKVSYDQVGIDPELKSSFDTYVPGHEFLPIVQTLTNKNPNLKGNSANYSTDNASYFQEKGWTIRPVVDLSK